MLDVKIVSSLNKIIQNSHFKKKVNLEEQKVQKEDRIPRGRQNDYFRVTDAPDTVLDYTDLLSITLRDDNVQEFDTRWDEKFFYLWQKCHLMIFWKVCTNWEYVGPDQIKTVLELLDMEIKIYLYPIMTEWKRWWREV